MLQENTQLNQDKITSFEQLKVDLRSLIATDDLEPELYAKLTELDSKEAQQ